VAADVEVLMVQVLHCDGQIPDKAMEGVVVAEWWVEPVELRSCQNDKLPRGHVRSSAVASRDWVTRGS
jgi:hypothetical protein